MENCRTQSGAKSKGWVAKIGAATLLLVGATEAAWGQALPIDPGSWTLAILPDTQKYVQFPEQYHHFQAQTQWLADHAASHNIQYAIHLGDITQNNNTTQWGMAKGALDTLNGVVPYALATGNHDTGPNGNAGTRDSLFNNNVYFGPNSAYANQSTVGGFFEPTKTENSYHTFSAGGQDWMILSLEWAPRDEVVDWANTVVADHPDHKVMLSTHAYMYYDETIYNWDAKGADQSWNPHSYGLANLPGQTINDGQQLWDKLVSQHENMQFVFNGHVVEDGTGYRSTEGIHGNSVHQMLANYQMNPEGGMGDMRLLEFKPDGQTVVVRTFSPSLERYDTAYDQEFTLDLEHVRPPLSLSTAVAANILVPGTTANTINSVEAVIITQASAPGVGHLEINRGDYEISVGGDPLVHSNGVLLATVRENVRVGYRATVEVGRNSFSNTPPRLALSIMETGNPLARELNFSTAVAWFQFATGWQGAHVDANGTINPEAANRVDQSMLTKTNTGRYTLDLGVDANTDGLLFAVGNNNENMVVQTGVLEDGRWDIRVGNNAADFAEVGQDRNFSFVYLPYETNNLIGGLYNGVDDVHASSVGDFSMQKLDTGQYLLTVDGETPDTGMLLLTVARQADARGFQAPDDNVLSYQDNGDGSFLIESIDLQPTSIRLHDTHFAWAFVNFENPLTPYFSPGDFNRDGAVDAADYQLWKSQFGALGEMQADGNGDGVVDAADYTIWRNHLQASPSQLLDASGSAVPEPRGVVLVVVGLIAAGWARRGRRG